MERIDPLTLPSPRLPEHGARARAVAILAGSVLHAAAAAAIIAAASAQAGVRAADARRALDAPPVSVTSIVFLQPTAGTRGGGGGGGGNRQAGPIRHASAAGADPITLRVRQPDVMARASRNVGIESTPGVVLDAKPLASGTFDQIGLPSGGVSYGTSTGPGSGGGVGDGAGTGIGSGRGPGVGPGEGGGIGGGVYRPGGAVTAPRVLAEVRPVYTPDALLRHVQGTVTLEIIVRRDGCASDVRVVRSLDPGLDEQAILAVGQWRFAPGRLGSEAVDVMATVLVDFAIR